MKAAFRQSTSLMRQTKRSTAYEARMESTLTDALRKFGLSGIGISLIAGIVLSILGPYQTGNLPFGIRFLYWTGLSFVGGLGAGAFLPLTRKLGLSPRRIATLLGQSLTATVAVTACLIGLDLYRSHTSNLFNLFYLFGFVWIISIIITSIAHLVENTNANAGEPNETRPAIYDRLKPSLRSSDIYALSSEDHYVRVYTSKGEDLVLMRLSDAIRECSPLPGLPVHRSWWVAEKGAKSIKKSDGKLQIELPEGQIAPVSRAKSKSVREAGWA